MTHAEAELDEGGANSTQMSVRAQARGSKIVARECSSIAAMQLGVMPGD
jgi:hypothetical protein